MATSQGQPTPAGGLAAPLTTLRKPKTKKGKRYLDKRAPKLVEDAKRALLLCGNTTSQVVKDVLTDIHKLKATDSVKLTRKNPDIMPFEAGGEVRVEQLGAKYNCSLFALASHTKKRPHNLVLGRLFDFRLYDALELGVEAFKSIEDFGGAATAQVGNKPCFVFLGERFESDPLHRAAKSLLLDTFRGTQASAVNLAGLDTVIAVFAAGERRLLLRGYCVKLKKSGGRVPRTLLEPMGPSLDLAIRRHRPAPIDLEAEAMKQPKLKGKKVKNVGTDVLDGKVGRIYMPKQKVDELGLAKMKGLKRERREAKAASKAAKAATAPATEEAGGTEEVVGSGGSSKRQKRTD